MPYLLNGFISWVEGLPRVRSRTIKPKAALALASHLSRLVLPAGFIVLALINVQFLHRLPDVCIYRLVFGVRCPGCGMTHAFCSVLHGHFVQAFSFNPLVVVAFPFFVTMAVRNLSAFLRDAFPGFLWGIPH